MFKPVSPKLKINPMEEGVLRFWKHRHIFQKSELARQGAPEYVFYEGPPTANGKPGVHHVLARVFKDIFPRYKNMSGFHVVRRGGWDTHGLPVEIEVEKRLGFTNKSQIEEYGIARFNELCRKSTFEYIQDWEKLTDRIAFWVDLDDAYVTYTNDYIESVWWILKNFWDKGLLYQGFKVVPYCPRCGTPRVGSFRYCRSCQFDFDSAEPVAPTDQRAHGDPPRVGGGPNRGCVRLILLTLGGWAVLWVLVGGLAAIVLGLLWPIAVLSVLGVLAGLNLLPRDWYPY